MHPELNSIIDWSKKAGQIIKNGFGQEHQIELKSEIDLVTEIDKQSEAYLIAEIRKRFPEHTVVGEESGTLNGHHSESTWYIDPLDGTSNYAHGVPIFSVSIAYAYRGKVQMGVVYDPMQNECFYAERGQGAYRNGQKLQVSAANSLIRSMLVTGFPYDVHTTRENNLDYFRNFLLKAQAVRRLGSAALDMCYVAAGRLDGYWELSLKAWDIAAGVLMVEESGGIVTKLDGTPFSLTPPYDIVVANPNIHSLMMDVVKAT